MRLSTLALPLVAGVAVSCVITLILLLGANLAAASMDRDAIRANVRASFERGDLETATTLWMDTGRGQHQFNDCLVVYQVIQDREPAIQRALSPNAWSALGDDPCIAAEQLISNPDNPPTTGLPYHNYLHGSSMFATAALSIAPIGPTRKLLTYVSLFALAGLAAMSAWRLRHAGKSSGAQFDGNLSTVTAFFVLTIALVLLNSFGIQFFGMSISHAPGDLLIYGYLWLVLMSGLWRFSYFKLAAIHAAFGALTAYFEFLTGGIPLGLCMILLTSAAAALSPQLQATAFHRAIVASAAFLLGILAAFCAKYILTAVVFGPAFLVGIVETIWIRMSGSAKELGLMGTPGTPASIAGLIESLGVGAGQLAGGWRLMGRAMLMATCLLVGICVWRLYLNRESFITKSAALCFLAFLVIVGWFLAFMSHTIDHPHFMPRIFAGSIAAALLMCVVVFGADVKRAVVHVLDAIAPADKKSNLEI